MYGFLTLIHFFPLFDRDAIMNVSTVALISITATVEAVHIVKANTCQMGVE